MPKKKCDLDTLVAYHEAGHAVMYHLVGFGFKEVSIEPDYESWSYGRVQSKIIPQSEKNISELDAKGIVDRVCKHGKCSLAGAAAEYVLLSCDGSFRSSGSAEDINEFQELIKSLKISDKKVIKGLINEMFGLAVSDLKENWDAVEKLANELLSKKSLSGKEAELVINSALKGKNRTKR
jgi:hypothetical protein